MYTFGALSCYIIFYAVFPILYRFVNNYRHGWKLFIAAAFIRYFSVKAGAKFYINFIGGDSYINAEYGFIAIFWYFAIGILIYHAWNENKIKELSIYLILLYISACRYNFFDMFRIGLFLSFALTIVFLVEGPRKKENTHAFHNVKTIERYTFTIYICHYFTFKIIVCLGSRMNMGLGLMAFAGVVLPVVIAIALYHMVCIPSAKVCKRMLEKIYDSNKN